MPRQIEAVIKAKGAPTIEYIYSKLTYFPEGQQLTKNVFIGLMNYSNLLRVQLLQSVCIEFI